MGCVGFFCRLGGEAAPFVRHQPRARLLRVDRRQCGGRAFGAGALGGGGSGGRRRRQELFGDLAYRSGTLGEELAEAGVLLATERADRRPQVRQQVEVCFAALKRAFGIGETLAITLAGLVTRIAAKVCAYTPTASTSTDSSGGRRGASRSCGPDVLATLI